MTTQKRALRILAVFVVIVGIVIVNSWFGFFGSTEYYKGFDWNTNKRKLEWRLSNAFYWYDESRYESSRKKLKEYENTWFQESFYIDTKKDKLKEVRISYTTDNSLNMEQIYADEVKKLEKRLGRGMEGESYDSLFTEWRGKHSIIRVIKNDSVFEDSNIFVDVVYQDKDEYNEPYFTEKHLWQSVYEKMINEFYCISTPEYNVEIIKERKDPDYSNFNLDPTDETKKVVALMNKYLSAASNDKTCVAGWVASSQGITEEHPLTVDWVMNHPAKALTILKYLTSENDSLKNRNDVDKAYERLTNEEKRKS